MNEKQTKSNYRESRYNIKQPIGDGKILLFNSYSEAMVVLREDYYEKYVDRCEIGSDTKKLAEMGIIVDEQIDEVFRVLCNKRTVAYTGDKKITDVKIMATSGCNACCWYCFEKGIESKRMTDDVIVALVSFLEKFGDKKSLNLSWFGGEPTLEKQTIFKVSDMLLERGFRVSSSIVTNGYLFDGEFMERMKLYNLDHVQITLDGLGEEYNRIKNYRVKDENPFERVMSNIETACNYDFYKSIRLNYSKENVGEILKIIDYLHERFGDRIGIYAAPIVGFGADLNAVGSAFLPIAKRLIEYGYITEPKHLHLQSVPIFCGAEVMNNFTVTPDGYLYKCSQEVSENDRKRAVGSVFDGPVINGTLRKWVEDDAPEKCRDCQYLPFCQHGCKGYRLRIAGLDYDCVPIKYVVKDLIRMIYEYKTKKAT